VCFVKHTVDPKQIGLAGPQLFYFYFFELDLTQPVRAGPNQGSQARSLAKLVTRLAEAHKRELFTHAVHLAKGIIITFAQYRTYLNFAKGREAYLFPGAAEEGGLFFLADVPVPSSCFSFAFFVLYFLVCFFSFASVCVSRSPLCCSSPRVVSSRSGLSLCLFPFFCFRLSSVYIPSSLVFSLLCLCSLCFL